MTTSHLSRIRPLDAERTGFYFKCKYNVKMELINMVFRQGYQHKYAYDYSTIEYLAHVMSNGVLQPPRLRFLCDIRPHLVEL